MAFAYGIANQSYCALANAMPGILAKCRRMTQSQDSAGFSMEKYADASNNAITSEAVNAAKSFPSLTSKACASRKLGRPDGNCAERSCGRRVV